MTAITTSITDYAIAFVIIAASIVAYGLRHPSKVSEVVDYTVLGFVWLEGLIGSLMLGVGLDVLLQTPSLADAGLFAGLLGFYLYVVGMSYRIKGKRRELGAGTLPSMPPLV